MTETGQHRTNETQEQLKERLEESLRPRDWQWPAYPWEKWLRSRASITLLRGVDFQVAVSSFRAGIYQAARRRGLVVRTSLTVDKEGRVDGIIINPTAADMKRRDRKPVGRPPKYPFDEWICGHQYVIGKDTHFSDAPSKVKVAIEQYCERHRIAVQINRGPYGMLEIFSCKHCIALGDIAWCEKHPGGYVPPTG